MTKFMFIYQSPPMPADAPEWTQEQMEAELGRWMAWAGRVGEGMVDFGAPLAADAAVTADGVTDSQSQISGYTILEAADLDAAKALADGHPHLAMPGASIEILQVQPVPGA
ncbi:hypothetical protein [Nocardioides sp.]|uniref:hypothetical protein n=1 Tax=Nocardioides sp. TaxID=35761 RepID=UPI003567C163